LLCVKDRSRNPLFGGLAVENCILVGCDLHDKSMLLKYAVGDGKSSKRSFANRRAGHVALVEWLRGLSAKAGGAAVYFAYEASGQGFVLYDRLTAAGFTCFVLAPSKMERSPKSRTTKCDERDAERVLCLVRRHVLASEELPSVWVPDRATRDERELTRGRQAVADKLAKTKSEVRMLLKRFGAEQPKNVGNSWCPGYRRWLESLVGTGGVLGTYGAVLLKNLLTLIDAFEAELDYLNEHVAALISVTISVTDTFSLAPSRSFLFLFR
jgi:transposase